METVSYKSSNTNKTSTQCDVSYLATSEKLTLHCNSYSFAITSDNKWVIIVSNDNNLVVLSKETGREASILTVNSKTEDIFLSLDGKLQTSQFQQGSAEEENTDQLEKVKTIDDLGSINAVAFTPYDNEIIFGSSDGSVRIWDWQTGNISLRRSSSPMTYKGHSNSVNALAIIPNTNQVISASSDKSLKVWDFVKKEYLFTLSGCEDGHESPINDLAVTPDGKNVISASDDKTLKVWDLSHRKVITTFTGDSAMKCCAVAPDGVTIVAGDVLGKIYILCLEGLKTDCLTEESKNQ